MGKGGGVVCGGDGDGHEGENFWDKGVFVGGFRVLEKNGIVNLGEKLNGKGG